MRLVILGSLLLVACYGRLVNQLQTPNGRLYKGMSADDVDDIMGPPHYVGSESASLFNKDWSYFRAKHFMFSGSAAVEWAWELHNGDVVVVWMTHGAVVELATVPADERKADDPIRGRGRR